MCLILMHARVQPTPRLPAFENFPTAQRRQNRGGRRDIGLTAGWSENALPGVHQTTD
jgi:hypothetical protein